MRAGRIRQWIGYGIIVIGLAVLASPFVTGMIDSKKQQSVVESVHKQIAENNKETNENKHPNLKEREAFYEAARSYNQEIFRTKQEKFTSIADTENFPLHAQDYGYKDEVIGNIWIPRMNIELGLYLGADSAHMALGAAIMGQTSVPLGLENENAAIAGHRGWNGTDMFRDIQKIQMHDAIYITTDYGTAVYRVYDFAIVEPDDHRWCQIQEGKTILTLMTCHPYTENTHRYIVFAQFEQMYACDYLTPQRRRQIQEEANISSFNDETHTVTEYHADGTQTMVSVTQTSIQPNGSEYGAVWSNVMILAEEQMKTVTIALAVIVAGLGIWLTVQTIREH